MYPAHVWLYYAEADPVRIRTPSNNNSSTCWVVYFHPPDTPAPASPGLRPVAVTATEQDALELLEQLLTTTPGRNNLVEDYPFHSSDRTRARAVNTRDTVHLVITIEDNDPTVSEVFDSIHSATKHAQELRQYGEDAVFITDMVMNTLPS